jgi:hypothetical protein
MGLLDRDYMRQRRDARQRSAIGSIWPWVAAGSAVAVGLWVLSKPPGWLAGQLSRLHDRPAVDVGERAPDAPTARVPAVAYSDDPPRPLRRIPDGMATQRPERTTQEQRHNPWRQPGTIYRCKAYGGGLFWSELHCSQQGALIDRIASVPPGLSFENQVRIADGQARDIAQSVQREQAEGARNARCLSLQHERDTIWRRSGSGAGYVSLDQLGADQTRWRQIEQLLAENRCVRR